MLEFQPFPKIARLRRNVVVTEKIDGTNAAVVVVPVGDLEHPPSPGTPVVSRADWAGHPYLTRFAAAGGHPGVVVETSAGLMVVAAQSRKRLITPDQDNFGFARWVRDHAQELAEGLGEGHHFGEWYGAGIQRRYGLDHKRFALFHAASPPACCEVVPVLWEGHYEALDVPDILLYLRSFGSRAVPGWMEPEGIVIWHEAARQLFKVTLEGDDIPKETR